MNLSARSRSRSPKSPRTPTSRLGMTPRQMRKLVDGYIPEKKHTVHLTKDPESGLQIIDGDGNFAFVNKLII